MIDFMVLSAPRSGSAWAANWLTTDKSLCFHGLQRTVHHTQWDTLTSERVLGVSDPSVCFFSEWLNKHPARKVILHRDKAEIQASLGAEEPIADESWGLDKINGMHVHWRELFGIPKRIYEFLLQQEFDATRHRILVDLQVNSMFLRQKLDPTLYRRLAAEVKRELSCEN